MQFTDWLDPFRTMASGLTAGLAAYAPRLVGAVLIVGVGWLVGKGVRFLVERLIRRLDGLIPTRLLGSEREQWGGSVVRIVSGLTFWLVLLSAFGAAAEVLGFSALTDGLSDFAVHLPRLISAVVVLVLGFVAGNLAASWVLAAATSAKIAYGTSAAKAVRAMIVLVASVVALAQAGIDSTLLVVAVSIALGAFLGGAALAFGLGARATVANILGAHYLHRTYRVNQRVRIGELEGRLLEIEPTGVLLETADGIARVPASAFTEQSSILLEEVSS